MAFLTPNATGEAGVLSSFVRNQLAQVRSTAIGLTDEQVHQRSTVSDFTLASLISHVGEVAGNYAAGIQLARDGGDGYGPSLADGAAGVDGLSVDQLLHDFDERTGALNDLLDQLEAGTVALDGRVPVPPAPWFPADLTHWEVRWVLVHVATETARHAGHADIIRESIDGKGSYELNALADGEDPDRWK